MSVDATSKKRPRIPRPLGCLLIGSAVVGVIIVALALAALIGYRVWSARAANRVEDELAKIRVAGEPSSGEELDQYYAHPAAEVDTTEIWLRATAPLANPAFEMAERCFRLVDDEEIEIPPPGQPWEKLAEAEQLLAEYSESLELLHEAAKRPGAARYPIDLSRLFAMDMSHHLQLRRGARLLALQAHVLAHQGDADAAMLSIEAISAIAHTLADEPILVSQLTRLSLDGVARDIIRQLLPSELFSNEQLDQIQADLQRINYHEGMKRAMLGERAVAIDMFLNPSKAIPDTPANKVLSARNDDLLKYLHFMNQSVDAAKRPWPEAIRAAHDADEELKATFERDSLVSTWRYMFTRLLTPASGAALSGAATRTALNRAAAVATAIEQFRRTH